MTSITQTTLPTVQTNYSSTRTEENIGKEFNNFIKLLTAQVRNQDPLSPMDSTQFVEQLATFSSLEQLVNSNSALGSIAAMISNLNGLMAGEWLGRDVSFESSWMPYTGEPATFSHVAGENVTRSVLTIKNDKGETVWSETLDPNRTSFSWDGRLTEGGVATKDTMYEFLIDTYEGETFIATAVPNVVTRVTDVISESGILRVGTAAGLTVDMAKVRRL